MDIETTNKLIVKVEINLHYNPNYEFYVNNRNIEKILYFNIDEEINFNLNVTSGAVEIKHLIINDKEILPLYMHVANPPTHWIEDCQGWELKIPKHFYAWYQELTGHGEIF